MLKIIYVETGSHIEDCATSPEAYIAARTAFVTSVGQRLVVEPSRATFCVPADGAVYGVLAQLTDPTIGVCRSEENFVEVSLPGFWLAEDSKAEGGVFVAAFDTDTESDLLLLWRRSAPALTLAE